LIRKEGNINAPLGVESLGVLGKIGDRLNALSSPDLFMLSLAKFFPL
jgi:hypothetical protein